MARGLKLRGARNADFQRAVTVTQEGQAYPLTGWSGELNIYAEAGASPLLTITESPSANGSVLTFTDPDNGVFEFLIAQGDVEALPEAVPASDPAFFVYDLMLTDPLGLTSRFLVGQLMIDPAGGGNGSTYGDSVDVEVNGQEVHVELETGTSRTAVEAAATALAAQAAAEAALEALQVEGAALADLSNVSDSVVSTKAVAGLGYTPAADDLANVSDADFITKAKAGVEADFRAFGTFSPTSNASALVQAAVDFVSARGGGVVTCPPAWRLDAQINIPSDVVIDLCGGVVDTTNFSSGTRPFSMISAAGAQIAIAASVTRGDTALSTVSAHGLAVGDMVQVLGQRVALSDDADPAWRLGDDNETLFFGEYVTVATVPTSTTFTIAEPLIFPDYKYNNASETAPNARAATTVQKITPVEYAGVRNGRILRGSYSSAIYGEKARFCFAEDVTVEMGTNTGKAVFWSQCLNTEARGCRALHDPSLVIGSGNHDDYNAFVTGGGQSCGFYRCYAEYGSQSFDLSFVGSGMPHLFNYVKECQTKGAKWDAITTHPGGYGEVISDNIAEGCAHSGIVLRSRTTTCTGNMVSGVGGTGTTGIALVAYAGIEATVAGNVVDGFDALFSQVDSIVNNAAFSPRATFSGNLGRNGRVGFSRNTTSTSATALPSGLSLVGNTFVQIDEKFVELEAYSNYVLISQNNFLGPLLTPASAAVDILADCVACVVTGNLIMAAGSTSGIKYAAIADTTTFPAASWPDGPLHSMWGNRITGVTNEVLDSLTIPMGSPLMGQRMRIGAPAQSGLTAFGRTSPGTEYVIGGGGLNTTTAYWPGVKWMATDTDLTTENPKLVAGITARATQTYSADTSSGAAVDIFASQTAAGATNVPVVSASVVRSSTHAAVQSYGVFLLPDGVAAPGTIVSGYAAIFVDTADGDLKIRFSDGTVKTIVVDT